jgi:hypothetical protein
MNSRIGQSQGASHYFQTKTARQSYFDKVDRSDQELMVGLAGTQRIAR